MHTEQRGMRCSGARFFAHDCAKALHPPHRMAHHAMRIRIYFCLNFIKTVKKSRFYEITRLRRLNKPQGGLFSKHKIRRYFLWNRKPLI